MFKNKLSFLVSLALMVSPPAFGQGVPEKPPAEQVRGELPAMTVKGQKTANLRPVTTYESPISNLDFDPRVDMQSRNMAEAQGDLSIRGGIFENTGIQVGAATLLDPQTGHYSTELPIAPEMLSEPIIHTGAGNALRGFNSSVGTVGYSWSRMTKGGSATIGGGDHDLNFQRLHNAWTGPYAESDEWTWGAEFEASRSESDGTIPYGDHDFARTTGRIQLLGPDSQTDLFAGYQDKFFGWPKLYTPYGNETESLKTRLVLLNHKQQYGDDSHWELTTFHRRHNDHYFLDAFGGINIIHETEVAALGLGGSHVLSPHNVINYAFQSTVDEIESSSLKNTDRTYFKLSLLPEHRRDLNDGQSISFKAGASFDDTNRDGSEVSPIAEISWLTEDNEGNSNRTHLSYAESTQVAGYTAIGGSETSGLFRSNHDLARETSKNLELGHSITTHEWMLDLCVFYRWDDDLTDWTYFVGDVNRTANPVDTETFGGEIIGSRKWQDFEVLVSYGYLSKDEDYKKPDFVGSFYALNFPKHRVTLGVIWDPSELLQIRVDNEWREQRENSIREGPDQLTYSHLAASYYPVQIEDLEVFISYDKPWDEDFQDIPGTPGRGDQFSLGATYSW